MEGSEKIGPVTLRFKTDEEQILDLCKRYWDLKDDNFKHKATDLSREFNISSGQLAKRVAQHCIAFSTDDVCSVCGANYVYSSRTDFQQRSGQRWIWKCEQCKREEEELKQAERLVAQERYRSIIKAQYAIGSLGPIHPFDLSFADAVYLLSFTRLLATEDFKFAVPLDDVRRHLSPTTAKDLEIIKQLHAGRLISVHPNSPIDAFLGEDADRFYISKVTWNLPFGFNSENPKDFASELEEMLRDRDWPVQWVEARVILWKEVAVQECLQYLAIALGEHGLNLSPGDKTLLVINSLLEHLSVGQIYNLIWRAAKDAAAFLVRERVSKQHAANTVVGSIQRYGERAKAEGWEIKPYRRHFECPQSMVSEVLFKAVLQIGDDGFKKVPTILDWPENE